MTDRWNKLATYNSEVARGIVHTDAWRAEMAEQQRQFDAERDAEMAARGGIRIPGGWLSIEAQSRRRWRWLWW